MEGLQSEAQQFLTSPLGGIFILTLGLGTGVLAMLGAWIKKLWNPPLSLAALLGVLSATLNAYDREHPFFGFILVLVLVETILVVAVGFWRGKRHGLPFSPRNFRKKMSKAEKFDELV